MIPSPLNYTGGKFKLLPQILPLFPSKINTFVDLFCGGGNVGINVDCEYVIYNDLNRELRCLFGTLRNLDEEQALKWVYEIIDEYQLSLVSKYGYEYYGCESSKGLGDYNRAGFNVLRADFNKKSVVNNSDYRYYIMLYVLIVYAFNNQIRFNSKGEFNLPVGKRDFNEKMKQKLLAFMERLHQQECTFKSLDFRDFDTSILDENDFVYVDPPYLITCATYNEQGGWNEDDERDLLAFLDDLDKRKIRFALSNVLRSKGKENLILIDWLKKNEDKYVAVHLNYSYSNSNYQTKDRSSGAEEVLIINYQK